MWHETKQGILINLDRITSIFLHPRKLVFYENIEYDGKGSGYTGKNFYMDLFESDDEAEKAYEELSRKLLQGE